MKLVLILIMLALPVQAELLDPSDLVYEGVIGPPKTSGQGPRFGRAPLGLEYDPTCAGREDPSPADGYPGCLAATSHKEFDMIAMFDIPAPKAVERGTYKAVPKGALVVDFFKCTMRADGSDIQPELDAQEGWVARDIPGIARSAAGDWICTCGHDWYDVTQTDYDSHCWFDFNPEAVNAQGAYGWGKKGDVRFHSQRMAWYLGAVPQGWADAYLGADGHPFCFGGMQRMGGGCPPCTGGPTLYAFPCERPSVSPPGPLTSAKELLSYSRVSPITVFDRQHPDFSPRSQARDAVWAGESVLISAQKGGDYWWYGKPDPWTDPNAHRVRCLFNAGDPEKCFLKYGPNLPAGTEDSCHLGKGYHALLDPSGATGPQYTATLQFYDADELAAVAANRRKPNSVLPYASVEGPAEFWSAKCQEPRGLAYDRERRKLYWVEFNNEGPLIHVYSVGAPQR
ncbi:MAG: hypothetical protein WBH85_02500 [Thermoanaerobaculia bacterium]